MRCEEAASKAVDDRIASLDQLGEGHSEFADRGGLTLRLTSFKIKVLKMKEEVEKMGWGG